jgi:hypothetical protein
MSGIRVDGVRVKDGKLYTMTLGMDMLRVWCGAARATCHPPRVHVPLCAFRVPQAVTSRYHKAAHMLLRKAERRADMRDAKIVAYKRISVPDSEVATGVGAVVAPSCRDANECVSCALRARRVWRVACEACVACVACVACACVRVNMCA